MLARHATNLITQKKEKIINVRNLVSLSAQLFSWSHIAVKNIFDFLLLPHFHIIFIFFVVSLEF